MNVIVHKVQAGTNSRIRIRIGRPRSAKPNGASTERGVPLRSVCGAWGLEIVREVRCVGGRTPLHRARTGRSVPARGVEGAQGSRESEGYGASRGVAMGRAPSYGACIEEGHGIVEVGSRVAPTPYEKEGTVRDVALVTDYRYRFWDSRGRTFLQQISK